MKLRTFCAVAALAVVAVLPVSAAAATGVSASGSLRAAASDFGWRQRLDLAWERIELVLPLSTATKARLHLLVAQGELAHAAKLTLQGHAAIAASLESQATVDLSVAKGLGQDISRQTALLENLAARLPARARVALDGVVVSRLQLLAQGGSASAPSSTGTHARGVNAGAHGAVGL